MKSGSLKNTHQLFYSTARLEPWDYKNSYADEKREYFYWEKKNDTNDDTCTLFHNDKNVHECASTAK
jgi:hypothetical protein